MASEIKATNSKPIEEGSSLTQYRIEQLEKQIDKLQQDQKSTIETNQQMLSSQSNFYTNHIESISFILTMVLGALGILGSILGFLGYKNLKQSLMQKIKEDLEPHFKDIDELKNSQREQINKHEAEMLEFKKEQVSLFSKHNKELENLKQEYQKVITTQKEQEKINRINELFTQSTTAYKENDFSSSIKFLTEAIGLSPRSHVLYNIRAMSKTRLADYDSALADYEEALRIKPQYAAAYYNRACTLCLKGAKIEEVLSDLKESIKLNSNQKDVAKGDKDFDSIKNNPAFRTLIGLQPL